MKDNDILGMEKDFELEAMRKKIGELEKEVVKLQTIIRDNDIDIEDIPDMSDEELICRQQISKLKEISDSGITFSKEDAQIFDTLVKDLRLILTGGSTSRKVKRKSKAEVKDLLSIAREDG